MGRSEAGRKDGAGGTGGNSISFLDRWKQRARDLELQIHSLARAYRDRRTPWYAKLFAGLVVAYALSPIDLIPDFIPVLGYLDDLLLVPLGIALALRMIPAEVMADARRQAALDLTGERPRAARIAAAVVVLIWLALLAVVIAALVLAFK